MKINMEIEMNIGPINNDVYFDKEQLVNLNFVQQKNNKREILINKLIEKFPKVKLHTIIEFNKYYNQNYQIEKKNQISNTNDIINNYLSYN